MAKPGSTFATVLCIALFFATLLVIVREYTRETTGHLSQDITTRLAEVSQRAADEFGQNIDLQINELQSIASFMAQDTCTQPSKCVQHYAPLLRAAGLKKFALVALDGTGFCSEIGSAFDLERTHKKELFLRALTGTAVFGAISDDNGAKLALAVPLIRDGKVTSILLGEFENNIMKKSLVTRAFGDKTCNMVFDDKGRLLFWAVAPGYAIEQTFPQLEEKGLPPSLQEHLLAVFADPGKRPNRFIKDDDHAYYLTHIPLEKYGLQVVSLLPEEVVDHLVDRQNSITSTLAWRMSVLALLVLFFIITILQRDNRTIRQQQEDYRSIISSISGGVIKFSGLHGSFQFISPNFLKMLGYRPEEFEQRFGENFALSIHEADRETALRTMQQQLDAGIPIDVEYRTTAKNGNLVWLYHKGSLVQPGSGQSYIQSIVFDITHNKETVQAKRISDERYQFILEQHDIIIFEQNLISGHFSCSAKWIQTFGKVFNILEPEAEPGLIPVHEDDKELLKEFQKSVHNNLRKSKVLVELRLRDASGLYHWYRVEASNLISAQGKPIYIIGIITDIDKQKQLELRLRTQATRDSATGMHNKRATEQAISRFLSLHNNLGPDAFAMFMIDFDNFKSINDRFGHAVGDKAIYQMAQIIRRNFRSTDIVGRVGGDEFLVFCTEPMPQHKIRERATVLVEQLHLQCGNHDDEDISLTASVGIACDPSDGHTFTDLYNHADMATYEAKRRGRNQCVFYAELTASEQQSARESRQAEGKEA